MVMSLVLETILVDKAAVVGTKLELSPVCLECWEPTDQVIFYRMILQIKKYFKDKHFFISFNETYYSKNPELNKGLLFLKDFMYTRLKGE
jgi:hypothetical protein